MIEELKAGLEKCGMIAGYYNVEEAEFIKLVKCLRPDLRDEVIFSAAWDTCTSVSIGDKVSFSFNEQNLAKLNSRLQEKTS